MILFQNVYLRNKKSWLGNWSVYSISLLVLIGSMAIYPIFKDVSAQSNEVFKVIVQITNTGNLDEHGTLHVSIDGSRETHVRNNLIFPALQTESFTFEFNADEVPLGKSFTGEVIYGDDEFKRAYGVNTAANTPETINIYIP